MNGNTPPPPWEAKVSVVNSWSTPVPAVRMPWGKHKGKPLSEIPRDYLQWALANATLVTPELREQIESVLNVQPATLPFGDDPDEDFRAEAIRLRGEVKGMRAGWDLDKTRLKNADVEIKRLKKALDEASRRRLADPSEFRRVVKQWYGAISRKFHPDLGGTAAQQTVANVCYQELMERLEGMEKAK